MKCLKLRYHYIWHGANWTYIIWGLLHGIALAIHKIWMVLTNSDKRRHSTFSTIISIILTFLFTTFCWIFFRAESLSQAITIIKRIFSFKSGIEQPYMWFFIAMIILIASSFCAYLQSKKKGVLPKKNNISMVDASYPIVQLNSFWGMVVFFVFCGLILCFAYTGGSPFIYGNY